MQATDRRRLSTSAARHVGDRLAGFASDPHRLTLVIAGALFVLCWPVVDRPGGVGLDRSWELALHLAATGHLRFGTDFIFTYGPLGFLTVPTPFLGFTSVLGLIYMAVLHASLCLAIALVAVQIKPLWVALPLAYVAARTITGLAAPDTEGIVVAVLVGAILVLDRRVVVQTGWLVGVAALISAIALLGKLDAGILVMILSGLAIAGSARRPLRAVAAFVLASALATGAIWVLLGQHLEDLVAYGRGAIQIIAGYSDAMTRGPEAGLLWEPLGILVAFALTGWLVILGTAGLERRPRIAILLACLVVAGAFTKIALTRWEATHQAVLFTAALFVALLYVKRGPRFEAAVIAFTAIAICLVAVSQADPVRFLNPVSNVRTLVRQGATIVLPGRSERAVARTTAQLQALLAVPGPILAALQGRTVQVDPWETSVIAGYPQLAWNPVPVFQSYSAYTPALDAANADRLASPDGPDAILRTPVFPGSLEPGLGTIDSRYRWFEAPEAMLETFCRYGQTAISGSWQILVRTGGKCGAQVPLGTVMAKPGVPVAVPSPPGPNDFVIVRIIGANPTPLEALTGAILRAAPWQVVVDGQPFRLVRATAGDGLLLAVPDHVRGSAPFDFGPPRSSISIRPSTGHDNRVLDYEFYAVPLLAPGS